MYEDAEERHGKALQKAAAWYYVTYGEERGRSAPALISFAWVAGHYLAEVKRKSEPTGP